MTTINLDLSTTLQQTLSNAGTGTYVYAFAFGATTAGGAVGLIDSVMVVENGALTSTTSLDVTAGQFYSGGVYVIIQQGGDGNLLTEISSASDIIQNATAKNYSYQLFEATLSGSQYDLGDISAVNTFGFTSTYEVVYQNGSDTRGFNTTAESIFSSLPAGAVVDYASNQFPNAEMLASGPATADDQAPWPSSGWQTYVDAVKNSASTLADIEIVYSFQGGSPLQSGAMLSQYSVEYVASDQYGEDYFWLVPDTSNGATNTDWIRIPVSQLVQNIFIQPGSLEVHQGGKGGTVVYYDSFTPDNAVGGVAKHFVAGFDAGFWGGQGVSANEFDNQTFDFNKGYNWNVNYAYDAILLDGVGSADFENTLVTNPGADDFIYDPWAQQFVANSNAYGYSYSDLVSAGGVNPQIALWDTDANANVETINITIYDTGEVPASGYKASSTGYVAPAITGYEAATVADTLQIGFDFNFSVGSTVFAPDENTSIALKIYAPGAAGADGDGFISLDVTGGSGANTGDWYYYIINPDATNTWAFEVSNATGEDGFFNIQNLPTTQDGSVAWYQLVFGEGDDQSIYNIYYDPTADNPLVVDHGIEVMLNPNGSYTLSFAPGGHMFYDIDTFAAPPTSDPSSAGAAIKGSKKTDFVNALYSVAGQDGPTSGADIINGREGNDYLSGLAGNDIIDGGKGVDMLRGNDGDDTLQVKGKEGIYDYFNGGADTDTLQFVGKGAVTLNGFSASAASIEMLDGNGRGLLGTKHIDVFDLSGLVTMERLPFIDAGGGNDSLTGSDFADDLRGGKGDDVLNGGDDSDTLLGGAGADTLNGDDGNDRLDGGKGIDTLNGGDGDDILQVRGKEGAYDTFDGGAGTDTLQLIGTVTLAGFDAAASSIEILQGAKRGLNGTNQADVFDLSGLTGAPSDLRFIDARHGDDIMTGSNFADDLRGGKGDDTLDGRGGDDMLDGGKGRNTFVFADGYDNDTIVKFQAGNAIVDLTGVSSVGDFSELALLMQQDGKNVLIDFGNGDTLTLQKTTIDALAANQSDFLFA